MSFVAVQGWLCESYWDWIVIKNVAKGTAVCAVGTLLYAAQQVCLFFTSSGKHQCD